MPDTELVIGFMVEVGNYLYGFNWVLKQDGSFAFEAELAGEILTTLIREPGCRHLPAPEQAGPPRPLPGGSPLALWLERMCWVSAINIGSTCGLNSMLMGRTTPWSRTSSTVGASSALPFRIAYCCVHGRPSATLTTSLREAGLWSTRLCSAMAATRSGIRSRQKCPEPV